MMAISIAVRWVNLARSDAASTNNMNPALARIGPVSYIVHEGSRVDELTKCSVVHIRPRRASPRLAFGNVHHVASTPA